MPPLSPSSPLRRFGDVIRSEWPQLVIEVLVVVAGITISFALNEWRNGREDRRSEPRTWEAIYASSS